MDTFFLTPDAGWIWPVGPRVIGLRCYRSKAKTRFFPLCPFSVPSYSSPFGLLPPSTLSLNTNSSSLHSSPFVSVEFPLIFKGPFHIGSLLWASCLRSLRINWSFLVFQKTFPWMSNAALVLNIEILFLLKDSVCTCVHVFPTQMEFPWEQALCFIDVCLSGAQVPRTVAQFIHVYNCFHLWSKLVLL